MGYSFSFTCRSEAALGEMVAFAEKHLRDGSEVLATGLRPRFQGLVQQGGIKYGHGPLQLGFNSPHDWEHAVLKWMALRVGKRRPFKGEGILKSVPWLNLDNQRSEPILLATEWPTPTERQEQWIADEHGFSPAPRWWREDDEKASGFEAQYASQDRLISAELRRLSALWETRT